MTSDLIQKLRDAESGSLPDGKTCGQCAHFERCGFLFDPGPDNTVCDFSPHRFRDAKPVPLSALEGES